MAEAAPLRVPVQLAKGGARWFRLADEVSAEALRLVHPVPDELDGPLELAFHLPGDPRPIRGLGRADELIVGEGESERAERRLLWLLDLDEEARLRIDGYVRERNGSR
jgi:hypothetical protein